MSLEDKLKARFLPFCDDVYMSKEDNSENCVNVLDEFSVGFAEFCSYYSCKNKNYKGEMLHAKSKYDQTYTTTELLEIYKQGL